jgi:hypothetical protein
MTPVRLVSQNGKFYNLNCTSISMDIDRKIVAMPMPFADSYRITADLNLTTSVITLEGYIVDNDVSPADFTSLSNAFIDFERLADGGTLTTATDFAENIGAYIYNKGIAKSSQLNNHSHFTTYGFTLNDGKGNANSYKDIMFGVISAQFATHTESGYDYVLKVHDGTNPQTNAQIAANLVALLGESAFSKITPSLEVGHKGGAGTKVVMTYTNPPSIGDGDGECENNPSPFSDGSVWDSINTPKLYSSPFTGGVPSSATHVGQMSAGDTVQQLTAIIGNSNNEWFGGGSGGEGSDYINGLQIPFVSKRNLEEGEDSTTRYFYSLTGYDVEDGDDFTLLSMAGTGDVGDEGTLEGDIFADYAKPAGTKFEDTRNGITFTGIKALVDKATFVQMGGEPNIYSFTILMLPTNQVL